jgi:hypothetical protein
MKKRKIDIKKETSMRTGFFPANAWRVKISTGRKANKKIQNSLIKNIAKYKDARESEITERIWQLEKEWDTERILETNASFIIFIGAILGFLVNSWLFLICGIISFFLLEHALSGWCPPLPLLRKLGVRTSYEICEEKAVLKYLRGDFDNVPHDARELARIVEK